MKQRYFAWISYKGTNYHGWQLQLNGITVQEVLQQAISTLLQTPTEITGAGRTDAGVHARGMVAHFDALELITDKELFLYKLNGILPNDIAVFDIRKVKSDAHARFDAIRRTYEYWITVEKNVFLSDSAMPVYTPLDFDLMNEAAAVLREYEDFTSFSKLHTDVAHNNCIISKAQWKQQQDDVWVFTITANRFLRNMVRAIVGTLFRVGKEQLSIDGFRTVIEAKDRRLAGSSASAKGLYLIDVRYLDSLFEE